MNDVLDILILPVSGGGFPCQLAGLQHLCQIKYRPNLILASSGGNVSAYILLASTYHKQKMERIVSELTPQFFVSPWTLSNHLSIVRGFFNGTVYNQGNGLHQFMESYFDSNSVRETEIWTGTYNKVRQKSQLFCNRSPSDSLIRFASIDQDLVQCLEPIYANGNVEHIANYTIASASIPALVPHQTIDGEHYTDGGIASASPLVTMQEAIIDVTRRSRSTLHLIYINSVDLSYSERCPCFNLMDEGRQTMRDLIRSQTVIDRLSGHQIIRILGLGSGVGSEGGGGERSNSKSNDGGIVYTKRFHCSYKNLLRYLEYRKSMTTSMLEIFPGHENTNIEINITSFKGYDISNMMHQVYDHCHCRLWYTGGLLEMDYEEERNVKSENNDIIYL